MMVTNHFVQRFAQQIQLFHPATERNLPLQVLQMMETCGMAGLCILKKTELVTGTLAVADTWFNGTLKTGVVQHLYHYGIQLRAAAQFGMLQQIRPADRVLHIRQLVMMVEHLDQSLPTNGMMWSFIVTGQPE
jgi:hypothetical protein